MLSSKSTLLLLAIALDYVGAHRIVDLEPRAPGTNGTANSPSISSSTIPSTSTLATTSPPVQKPSDVLQPVTDALKPLLSVPLPSISLPVTLPTSIIAPQPLPSTQTQTQSQQPAAAPLPLPVPLSLTSILPSAINGIKSDVGQVTSLVNSVLSDVKTPPLPITSLLPSVADGVKLPSIAITSILPTAIDPVKLPSLPIAVTSLLPTLPTDVAKLPVPTVAMPSLPSSAVPSVLSLTLPSLLPTVLPSIATSLASIAASQSALVSVTALSASLSTSIPAIPDMKVATTTTPVAKTLEAFKSDSNPLTSVTATSLSKSANFPVMLAVNSTAAQSLTAAMEKSIPSTETSSSTSTGTAAASSTSQVNAEQDRQKSAANVNAYVLGLSGALSDDKSGEAAGNKDNSNSKVGNGQGANAPAATGTGSGAESLSSSINNSPTIGKTVGNGGEKTPEQKQQQQQTAIAAGVGIPGAALVVLVAGVYFLRRRRFSLGSKGGSYEHPSEYEDELREKGIVDATVTEVPPPAAGFQIWRKPVAPRGFEAVPYQSYDEMRGSAPNESAGLTDTSIVHGDDTEDLDFFCAGDAPASRSASPAPLPSAATSSGRTRGFSKGRTASPVPTLRSRTDSPVPSTRSRSSLQRFGLRSASPAASMRSGSPSITVQRGEGAGPWHLAALGGHLGGRAAYERVSAVTELDDSSTIASPFGDNHAVVGQVYRGGQEIVELDASGPTSAGFELVHAPSPKPPTGSSDGDGPNEDVGLGLRRGEDVYFGVMPLD